ncbi:MAG: hypothetical protein L7U42_04620, partial [Candidatus Nanopelagicales bacterium]|nr:hypothetical protein [Candidatus Nanopelagicales bacterium]
GSRMSRNAKSELSGEPLDDMSRVLDRVDAVTRDDVHAVATDLFTQNFTVAAIGPFDAGHTFSAVG